MAHERWLHELVAFLVWQRHHRMQSFCRLPQERENLGETRIGGC